MPDLDYMFRSGLISPRAAEKYGLNNPVVVPDTSVPQPTASCPTCGQSLPQALQQLQQQGGAPFSNLNMQPSLGGLPSGFYAPVTAGVGIRG